MIQLNDTTPSPPPARVNVKWQSDASGNVSGHVALTPTKLIIAPVAGVLTIDASQANSFYININSNITSIVINNATDGQEILLLFAMGATVYTVAMPSILVGAAAAPAANKHNVQKFTYNGPDGNWYLLGGLGI